MHGSAGQPGADQFSHAIACPASPAAPLARCSSAVAPPPLKACLLTLFLICLGVSLQRVVQGGRAVQIVSSQLRCAANATLTSQTERGPVTHARPLPDKDGTVFVAGAHLAALALQQIAKMAQWPAGRDINQLPAQSPTHGKQPLGGVPAAPERSATR